jgi:DNA-binding GntR family transcriptional regulator
MREALLQLEREGVVAATIGHGFVVRPLTVVEARDTYPIIGALECLALRESPLPDPARLSALRRANLALDRAAYQPARMVDADARWHELLLSGCPNLALLEMIRTLTIRARRYELAFMRHAGEPIDSALHHRKIIAALARRDLAGATHWLERNWLAGRDLVLRWLESRGGHAPDAGSAGAVQVPHPTGASRQR